MPSLLGNGEPIKSKTMKPAKTLLLIILFVISNHLIAQTVYTTKTGEKYHKEYCKYLKYSKKEITLKKAKGLGYTACSVCKPNANNTKKTSATNTNTLTSPTKAKTATRKTTASQCIGKTKSGSRCKRMTKNSNSKCYQH